MFKETRVISRASNNKGKVDTTPSYPRKTSKISLHDLNLINTKYLDDVTAATAQEDKELQQLSKMIRSHSLNERKTPDSLLKRIIPKYKPNSRIHKTSASHTSGGDKILKPTLLVQPLKQTVSHSEADTDSSNIGAKSNAPRSSASCIKIPATHQPNSSRKKGQNKIKSSNSKKSGRKVVRFEKKITVHYVPADEQRGSYEWRKNLTRQGIYEAMLWKSEIEKIELEEAALLARNNNRKDINNNNVSSNNNNNNNNNNNSLRNSSILAVYGLK